MSKEIKIDLTNEKPSDYVCPKCQKPLSEQPVHIKQKHMLMMYCLNDTCPIVRVKIFNVG